MRRTGRGRVRLHPFEILAAYKKMRFFSKTDLTFLGMGLYKPDIDGVAAD
jgi:hypothetical protein